MGRNHLKMTLFRKTQKETFPWVYENMVAEEDSNPDTRIMILGLL